MSTNIVGNEIIPDVPIVPEQSPTFTSAPNLVDLNERTVNPDFGHKARAYRSSNQTITTATDTKVVFDTESYDGSSNFDTTTSRFTTERVGWYYIFTKIYMSGLADGKTLTVTIRKNGSIFSQSKNTVGASADATNFNADVLRLNAGDYIEVYVEHNHGSDRTVDAGEGQSFLLVHLIS